MKIFLWNTFFENIDENKYTIYIHYKNNKPLKYFEKLGIPARFFITSKHANGGMYGCFDSHIQILIDAYKRDLDNILVFIVYRR